MSRWVIEIDTGFSLQLLEAIKVVRVYEKEGPGWPTKKDRPLTLTDRTDSDINAAKQILYFFQAREQNEGKTPDPNAEEVRS